jgi:hypothetical protein
MNPRLGLFVALLCASLQTAQAHRVDEYLQATFIAVEKEQLRIDLFLTPGLNVLPAVLVEIDTDGDGAFSAAEQQIYARRVLRDLSFTINGAAVSPALKQLEFPTPEQLRDGRGDIHLELVIKLPPVGTADTQLRFENRHESQIAAYQVNCLATRDPAIRLGAPQRDPLQSTLVIPVAIKEPAKHAKQG